LQVVRAKSDENHRALIGDDKEVRRDQGPQFRVGRESVEDSRRGGRAPNFEIHFRIEGAIEASPNTSVRDIAQTTGIAPSTVLHVLTQVLHLQFRNWRWVRCKLSDDQRRRKAQLALSLQAELEIAQRRSWTELYTGDESWAL
jgi:hypothetical protein